MNSLLISIIIPTYNRANLIGETLDSVLAQTYTNWECIVVDDGSTDETAKLLAVYCEKDLRFQYHHRPINRAKGANACRNYGFELSKGEYVNWFDDDDVMHKDKVLIQVKGLEENDYNFSVCQTLVFENTIDNIIGLRSENIYSDDVFYDYLTQKISWLTQAPLWRKKFLLSFEYLFDEELQAAQEWEFHCRVLFSSPNYHVTETPLVYIRRHFESISYNNQKEKRELNYYFAREKIYNFLKEKGIRNDYLISYFISHYKYFLKSRRFILAFEVLRKKILYSRYIVYTYKSKLLLAFFIYGIFNKGEFIFKGERFRPKNS